MSHECRYCKRVSYLFLTLGDLFKEWHCLESKTSRPNLSLIDLADQRPSGPQTVRELRASFTLFGSGKVCRRQCATSAKTAEQAVGVRNYITDEGRPLGTGLQEQVSNHLRRRWSKARVVSTGGKGLARTRSDDRQKEDRKGTTDELSKA